MSPHRLAILLAFVAALCVAFGLAQPGFREAAIVVGLALACLAGGVLNWDRRAGH